MLRRHRTWNSARRRRTWVARWAQDAYGGADDTSLQEVKALVEQRKVEELPDFLETSLQEGNEGIVEYAVQCLLDAGALRAAISIYQRWCWDEQGRIILPVPLTGEVLRILAASSQYLAAVSHLEALMSAATLFEDNATSLFNMILLGMQQSGHPLTPNRVDQVVKRMIEARAEPNSETLRTLVESKMQNAGPGFLMDVGQTVLDLGRRFAGIPPQGTALLAVSAAHLRAGDIDAAYRWFLASQLEEKRQSLGPPSTNGVGSSTLELVSQLARGLAVAGQATQLLRLLQRVQKDKGKLPRSTASVALAGYTSGRTLATCWLEPPADVVRRRGIWASGDKVRVTCAEQWNWSQLDASRHEVHQWHPYMAPDTKLERAWVTPFRAFDVNALGLVRDWCGETPAQATARERLGERDKSPALDMRSALCVEPPGARVSNSSSFFSLSERAKSRPVALTPKPRTWRSFQADVVKKAFATSNRFRAASPERLRQVLLAEKSSQLLLGAKQVPVNSQVPWLELEANVKSLSGQEKEALIKFEDVKNPTRAEMEEALVIAKFGEDFLASKTKSSIIAMFKAATSIAKGESCRLEKSDEDYLQSVQNLSDDELEQAWKLLYAQRSTEIMGPKLSAKVEASLLEELEEDEKLRGSAQDELELALEVLSSLRDVGVKPTSMDCKALLQAAHAIGNPELATKVMESLAGTLDELEEPPTELGLAGQTLLQAMQDGGWEKEASEEFLKGKRVFTRRDPNESLGQLQTRYLDPLQGAEPAETAAEDRQDLLEALTKPYAGKLEGFFRRSIQKPKEDEEEQDEDDRLHSVRWQNGKDTEENEESVTRAHILAAGVRHPLEAEAFLMWVRSNSKWMTATRRVLAEKLSALGLPIPKNVVKMKQLLGFVASVLEESAEARQLVG